MSELKETEFGSAPFNKMEETVTFSIDAPYKVNGSDIGTYVGVRPIPPHSTLVPDSLNSVTKP